AARPARRPGAGRRVRRDDRARRPERRPRRSRTRALRGPAALERARLRARAGRRAVSAAVAVRFDGVSVERDRRLGLEDLTFTVRAGQFVGIVGPNGAGKTTLLRALLGLVPIASGRIEVLGRPPGAAHGEIGYVPQRHAVASGFPATVRDVVALGRLGRAGGRRAARAAAEQALARVELLDRADRPVGRLSGGEQRRVLLAQALCAGTRLLVLDE